MRKHLFLKTVLFVIGTAGIMFSSPYQTSEELNNKFLDELRKTLQLSTGIIEQHRYDLPDMLKAKKIRILTTYTFANYFIHQGQAYGFEYSNMEEFRKFLIKGKSQKEQQLDFYFIPLPYDMLIRALNNGYGDIVAANMTITPDRSREVEFTSPYLWDIKEVLISRNDGPKINSREDLSGIQVHVRQGSSYVLSLQKLNQELEEKKLKPAKIETLPGVISTDEIIEMLNAGLIDFTIADSHIASLAGKIFQNIKINEQIVLNADVRLGWMVRKNNPGLKESLNRFVSTVKKGTLLGNMFYNRYFKDNPWHRRALSREDLKRLEGYREIAKKYADKYGFDWLLLAAQAYQESRFDPKARSRTGAVGLMQMLPSTGKEMGFNNITSPENNIHAAAKYLRWIIDNYFQDEAISDDDRLRFALAAYNAGPTNIKRSRARAAKMGLDENQWFNQTELGAMQQVSLEPVHYVRNINNYYLSFRIATAMQDVKESSLKKK